MSRTGDPRSPAPRIAVGFGVAAAVVVGFALAFAVGFAPGFGLAADLAAGVPKRGTAAGTTSAGAAADGKDALRQTVGRMPSSAGSRRVSIGVAGDILLARKVGDRIEKFGWVHPFVNVPDLLQGSDIAFANLECPASSLGVAYPGKMPEVTFRAAGSALYGLKHAGFDVLSLANNHTNDYGPLALQETIDSLKLLGIEVCGAGADRASARSPAVLEVGGVRVAFLAYAEPLWSVVEADIDSPGVAIIDESDIVEDLYAARKRADLVLVSLHWGEEHQGVPRERDRELARRLVDAGADGILGHHPHVLQGAEYYKGAPILYSMGNFVFDMISPATYDSALARLEFTELGAEAIPTGSSEEQGTSPVPIRRFAAEIRFVPIRIDPTSYAPARAAQADSQRILRILQERCASLGSGTTILEDGTLRLDAPKPE
jgi:poly-gamma-glutamate synthesis protein (capsule biosynthesis protein)